MTRLLDFIRRHPRLSGGVAVVLLAAIATVAVRASGPAHAAPDTAHATASRTAVASASLPSTVRPAITRPVTASISKSPRRSTSASRVAHHGGASIRPGIATAPATSRGVALALRAATGLSPSQVTTRQVCAPASADEARCAAEALVLRATGAVVHPRVQHSSSGGPTEGDSPAFLQQAYDLSSLSQNAGSGDTVALIDAYNDSTAQSDLNAYRSNYGLSACTTTNGCFREINEWGGSSLPTTSATAEGWDYEISLDLDTVSAICPNCHILLVEARSSNSTDLERAMQAAASDGATQISDSWTMQSSSAPAADFVPSGVPVVAATGDDGYVGPGEDNYPAGMPGVTAAGGTSLAPATGTPSGRGFGETAWSDAGSGCDVNEPQPAYQTGACGGRAYADVSADADPDTGLAVYDSAEGGWVEVGGTSLASPMIAAYYAITGVNGSNPAWAYSDSGQLNDITSGSNGSCAIAYICTAGVGYDGPTGVGSISGDVVAGAPGIGGGTIPTGQSTPTNTQSVGAKTATIAGGIYPNQTDTTWWIQYGTSTHPYGLSTPQTDIGAGGTAVPVTAQLSQLAPNTTYAYRLVAQNSLGTVYGTTYSFTTLPSSSFTFSPSAPTPSAQVSFTADPTEGSASTLSYAWSFGDGQTQTTAGQTVSHSYASNGVYTVSLTVTNGAHQSTTTTQTVTVDNPPTAAFAPSESVGGATAVSFDGSGSTAGAGSSIADYSWNFGDGSTQDTGTASTAQHTFAAPGVYSVALTATDEFNVSNTVTKNVIAGAFAATTTVPTEGTAVTFNVPSLTGIDGTISDHSWSFGDGSTQDTGTTPSATNTYSQRGTYTVTLTITTSTGQTATGTETITVDTPPTPAFAASAPVSGATAVSFDGSGSTTDTGGSIADYSWNYGDGATADTGSTSTAAHTFANSGIYPVTLTTTDDLGVSNTVTQNVIAGAFTASTNVPAPGAPVTFSVPNLAGVDGTITDYSWSFGDGSTEDTGPTSSVTYTYSQRDDYTVTLTITTSTGQTATGTETIAVDNPPTAAVDSSNSTAVAAPDQTVDFNGSQSATEAGSIESYTWNFGDGTTPVTSDSPTASHTYASPGRYTATLTVTDDLGVSDTTAATEQVVVDQPDAVLAGPTTTIAPDAVASFNAGSSSDPEGTITDYSWQFGDGATLNTGTTPTATHLYTQRGQHTVTVTVTNSYGQTTSTQSTVTIDAAPTAAFTPSTTLTTPGGAVGFNASASAAMAGGSIADYSWNYGDGSGQDTGTAPDAEHNYGAPGTYTVTLTTTDDLGLSASASAQVTIQAPAATSTPTSTSTPTPTPVAAPKPLTASLTGAKKQKLAPALTHGLHVSLAVNQGTTSTFQVTLPVLQSKLAQSSKNKKASIVLLHTGAQTLGAGSHAVTLKLSRAAARELAGSGPLVLTVKVTLTEASGATVTRSLKITLAR